MHSTSQASAHEAYLRLHGLNPVPENATSSERSASASLTQPSRAPSPGLEQMLDVPDQAISLVRYLGTRCMLKGMWLTL